MPIPLIPALVTGAAAVSAYLVHRRSKAKVMTPARQKIYDQAMNNLKEPEKLQKLSQAFASQGLKEQAEGLAKRAKLRALPKQVKEERRVIFKQALTLKNPTSVKKIASAFRGEGCTGAADALDRYAAGLPRDL